MPEADPIQRGLRRVAKLAFLAGVAIKRIVAVTVLTHLEVVVEAKIQGELGRHPSYVIVGVHE